MNQTIVQAILRKHVTTPILVARNGLEAVEIVKQATVHIILMDVMMPVMDGLQATRCIRKLERRSAQITRDNGWPAAAAAAAGSAAAQSSATMISGGGGGVSVGAGLGGGSGSAAGVAIAESLSAPLPPPAARAIIGLTAFVSAEEREACLESGMDAFLPKPVGVPLSHRHHCCAGSASGPVR